MAANYRLIAVQVGDALKYATSINEINRIAGAIFLFPCERFPNDAITSSRAQLIHNWILSLAKQKMEEEERNRLLNSFCDQLSGDTDLRAAVRSILQWGCSWVRLFLGQVYTLDKPPPSMVTGSCSLIPFLAVRQKTGSLFGQPWHVPCELH
ncbi:MAG: hypothetical protein V1878_04955, partial [bacterium]